MKRGDLCKVVPADIDDPIANRLAGQIVIFDRKSIKQWKTTFVVVEHADTGESIRLREKDIKEI